MEGDLATFGVIELAVAAAVIEPEEGERAQHQQSVEDDIEGEIRRRDHGPVFARRLPGAKGKESPGLPSIPKTGRFPSAGRNPKDIRSRSFPCVRAPR